MLGLPSAWGLSFAALNCLLRSPQLWSHVSKAEAATGGRGPVSGPPFSWTSLSHRAPPGRVPGPRGQRKLPVSTRTG